MSKLAAIFLYGSRARGDGAPSSDTDLIGVSEEGDPAKAFDSAGVSLHVYPLPWLITESFQGALFALHLRCEAVAIFDPRSLLPTIRDTFQYKDSYREEIESGCRIVTAFAQMNRENFSPRMRRRYYWGLRTAIMGAAADTRRPAFSSEALEAFTGIAGLAEHIRRRDSATFEECREFGPRAIAPLGAIAAAALAADPKENLERLFEFSGVAGATAGEIIYGF